MYTHTPQTKFQEHQTKLYIIRQFRKTLLSLGPALTVTHSSCELVYQKNKYQQKNILQTNLCSFNYRDSVHIICIYKQ
jgi:hypothetical protein